MNAKPKILAALDCQLDDLSEDRLLDILLYAYESKKRRIQELEKANAKEREQLRQDLYSIRRERNEMRSKAKFTPCERFFIFGPGPEKYRLVVGYSGDISLSKRVGHIDYVLTEIPHSEWSKAL